MLCFAKSVIASAGTATLEPIADSRAKTYVFVCDDQTTLTVRATGTEAWIFYPEGTRKLLPVSAAPGRNYADSRFTLSIEDQEAKLGEIGAELLSCRNDRRRAIWEKAKLDGADFRAVGNEPGWTLEFQHGSRIVLVSDYGASRVEAPLPEPAVDVAARTSRWETGDLTVEVVGQPCSDSMSGEVFEARVEVTWQGRMLQGCGRTLH